MDPVNKQYPCLDNKQPMDVIVPTIRGVCNTGGKCSPESSSIQSVRGGSFAPTMDASE